MSRAWLKHKDCDPIGRQGSWVSQRRLTRARGDGLFYVVATLEDRDNEEQHKLAKRGLAWLGENHIHSSGAWVQIFAALTADKFSVALFPGQGNDFGTDEPERLTTYPLR